MILYLSNAFILLLLFLFSGTALAQDNVQFTTNLRYDPFGRVERIEHPNMDVSQNPATAMGRAQEYTYSEGGGHKQVFYDDALIVEDTFYNNAGLPFKMRTAGVDQLSGVTVNRRYDNLNRLRSLIVTLDGNTIYKAHNMQYNDWNFLVRVQRSDPGFSGNMYYQYNDMGQLSLFTINGRPVNYTYDSRGNLIQHNDLDYQGFKIPNMSATYNLSNQRTDSGWAYDSGGRLTSDDNFSYTYNDIEQKERITESTTTERWDVAQYLYDGNGYRVREIFEDRVVYSIRLPDGKLISQEIHYPRADGSWSSQRKDFIYHNDTCLMTAIASFDNELILRQYTFRDRLDSPAVELIYQEQNQPRYFPEYLMYSPYGIPMKTPNRFGALSSDVTLQYTGHELDEISHFYYMGMRYYNPHKGAFNRPDPAFDFDLSNPATFNLYVYTRGNPVNYVDPDGLYADTSNIRLAGSASGPLGGAVLLLRLALIHHGHRIPQVLGAIVGVVSGEDIPGVTDVGAGRVVRAAKWRFHATKFAKKVELKGASLVAEQAARMTSKEYTKLAKKLGYRKLKVKSHGQAVYTDGKNFITPDVDSHSGGVWKMAESVKKLASKQTRTGTFDKNLKKIGN